MAFNPAHLEQPVLERGKPGPPLSIFDGQVHEYTYQPHPLGLLRPCAQAATPPPRR